MLTSIEQVLFIIFAVLTTAATYNGFHDLWRTINRGTGQLHTEHWWSRAARALRIYITQSTTLRTRRLSSVLHLGIVWGFTFYFLVNVLDVLRGYIPGLTEGLMSGGLILDTYRLLSDVLSIAVIVGVAYFVVRRFILPSRRELTYHNNILLHPKLKDGSVTQDSLIVALFILVHVGARFLGESAYIASTSLDYSQPFASVVSVIWSGAGEQGLVLIEHLLWWLALGAILLFLPYFPYTKHAHLFMAPFNNFTAPKRTSMGALEPLDLEDEDIEQFGANKLEHLSKTQLVDAFACIMCNRCQDVCPAYVTGKPLSPSALEINKRLQIKEHMHALAEGAESEESLMGFAISESAVWACTACGACIDICPVGNEPMLDILDIRRDAVLTQGEFPAELQTAFNGMERQGNPWQLTGSHMKWAEGLDVPTIDENPDFDLLFWMGCAVSYDERAAQTARAFVRILHAAGVNFAVLGEAETCTGDSARRAGNEYLFYEMAQANIETLNEANPKRIVTICPHCFHTLAKEYPQFGGNYAVVHHSQLIGELVTAGRVPQHSHPGESITYHDPCYLGRQNGILREPRTLLAGTGADMLEMPHNGMQSFCCGAGGAQFWKEEEEGEQAVNVTRYAEAKATGANTVAVGCPFCMQMMESAQPFVENGPVVKDIAEIIADRLPEKIQA